MGQGARRRERLAEVQDRLLAAAVAMLKPGGVLVYAVCSLQPEEGPQRIEALLAAGRRVERDPIRPRRAAGPAGRARPAGEVRTLPCQLAESGGLDGFFIARLRRRDA